MKRILMLFFVLIMGQIQAYTVGTQYQSPSYPSYPSYQQSGYGAPMGTSSSGASGYSSGSSSQSSGWGSWLGQATEALKDVFSPEKPAQTQGQYQQQPVQQQTQQQYQPEMPRAPRPPKPTPAKEQSAFALNMRATTLNTAPVLKKFSPDDATALDILGLIQPIVVPQIDQLSEKLQEFWQDETAVQDLINLVQYAQKQALAVKKNNELNEEIEAPTPNSDNAFIATISKIINKNNQGPFRTLGIVPSSTAQQINNRATEMVKYLKNALKNTDSLIANIEEAAETAKAEQE